MTSVSIVSLSFRAACGLMIAGGASITDCPFFFAAPVFAEKNEPKKLGSSLRASTSRSLLLFTWFLVFLGSVGAGGALPALRRSVTIAVAYEASELEEAKY